MGKAHGSMSFNIQVSSQEVATQPRSHLNKLLYNQLPDWQKLHGKCN